MKEGLIVQDIYGDYGTITECFENWDDLKSKAEFLSMTPDEWLDRQLVKPNTNQLWYGVKFHSGGTGWCAEDKLTFINPELQ